MVDGMLVTGPSSFTKRTLLPYLNFESYLLHPAAQGNYDNRHLDENHPYDGPALIGFAEILQLNVVQDQCLVTIFRDNMYTVYNDNNNNDYDNV